MSIVATIDAIQAINRTIPGVVTAPPVADYPASLNPSLDCPFLFTWPKGGQWDEAAIGLNRDQETWVITVLVAPVGEGIRGDVVSATINLLEACRMTWINAAHQDIGGSVEQIQSADHGGLQTLTFAGIDYYGFQVTIHTVLKEMF